MKKLSNPRKALERKRTLKTRAKSRELRNPKYSPYPANIASGRWVSPAHYKSQLVAFTAKRVRKYMGIGLDKNDAKAVAKRDFDVKILGKKGYLELCRQKKIEPVPSIQEVLRHSQKTKIEESRRNRRIFMITRRRKNPYRGG